MEDRSQRVTAVSHRMKPLARRTQGRGSATASFPELISQPSYVEIIAPVIHYRMGGLEIDEHSAVMKPVPDLCASKEVVGGVHGNS